MSFTKEEIMQQFFLICEDLLDPSQKRVLGPFSAETQEALVDQFSLQRKKEPPRGGCFPAYWDGQCGDVVIYIVFVCDHRPATPEQLQQVIFRLHRDWY